MARITKILVVERECFAFELFKAGLSIKEVNDKLLLKYGSKMATTRLGELRKTALAEVFGDNTAILTHLIDQDAYKAKNQINRLQEEIARLQPALTYANNKEAAAEPTRNHPEDLQDLERAYAQNREMAIKIQEQDDKIGELETDITDLKAKIDNLNNELNNELTQKDDTITELEARVAELEECENSLSNFESFLEEICDRKGMPVDELKLAIQADDVFKACKIIGL